MEVASFNFSMLGLAQPHEPRLGHQVLAGELPPHRPGSREVFLVSLFWKRFTDVHDVSFIKGFELLLV